MRVIYTYNYPASNVGIRLWLDIKKRVHIPVMLFNEKVISCINYDRFQKKQLFLFSYFKAHDNKDYLTFGNLLMPTIKF